MASMVGMWRAGWVALVALVVGVACAGSSDDDSSTASGSGVGKRCSTAGDCAVDLACKTDFAGERAICTKACTTQEDCGSDIECVSGMHDYTSQPLSPFCMKPCVTNGDCGIFGAVCDDMGVGRYCY